MRARDLNSCLKQGSLVSPVMWTSPVGFRTGSTIQLPASRAFARTLLSIAHRLHILESAPHASRDLRARHGSKRHSLQVREHACVLMASHSCIRPASCFRRCSCPLELRKGCKSCSTWLCGQRQATLRSCGWHAKGSGSVELCAAQIRAGKRRLLSAWLPSPSHWRLPCSSPVHAVYDCLPSAACSSRFTV